MGFFQLWTSIVLYQKCLHLSFANTYENGHLAWARIVHHVLRPYCHQLANISSILFSLSFLLLFPCLLLLNASLYLNQFVSNKTTLYPKGIINPQRRTLKVYGPFRLLSMTWPWPSKHCIDGIAPPQTMLDMIAHLNSHNRDTFRDHFKYPMLKLTSFLDLGGFFMRILVWTMIVICKFFQILLHTHFNNLLKLIWIQQISAGHTIPTLPQFTLKIH